ADSVILTPEIPEYLYQSDDTIWSNEVDSMEFLERWNTDEREMLRDIIVGRNAWCNSDEEHNCVFDPETPEWDAGDAHEESPYVAQPPYFLTQNAISRALENAETARRTKHFPMEFIDWFW